MVSFAVYVPKRGDPPYAAYTEPFIRAYCRRHGYDLFIGDLGGPRHPSWSKLLAHQALEAELILVMDLDFLCLPQAPPIHPFLARDRFTFCRDPLMPTRWGRRRARARGYPPEALKYNAGLFGFPRGMRDFLEDLYRRAEEWPEAWIEQGHVNFALHQTGTPVQELDPRWNRFIPKPPGDVFRLAEESYFLHLAGKRTRTRCQIARSLHEKYSATL